MSGGPKRNPDRLNTIAVVVVGICSAVLVYVTIVALQAFYMNDTSELQTMADYGGNTDSMKAHRADEMRNITEPQSNGVSPGMPQTYRIPIERAMEMVVEDAKKDPSHLVPAMPPSMKATTKPIFGRPQMIEVAPVPGAGSGAGSAAGSGSGSGSGSAAAVLVPTGTVGGHAR